MHLLARVAKYGHVRALFMDFVTPRVRSHATQRGGRRASARKTWDLHNWSHWGYMYDPNWTKITQKTTVMTFVAELIGSRSS